MFFYSQYPGHLGNPDLKKSKIMFNMKDCEKISSKILDVDLLVYLNIKNPV